MYLYIHTHIPNPTIPAAQLFLLFRRTRKVVKAHLDSALAKLAELATRTAGKAKKAALESGQAHEEDIQGAVKDIILKLELIPEIVGSLAPRLERYLRSSPFILAVYT